MTLLGRLEVGPLGLGCMGMSQSYGPGDDVESIATIHRALDLGVTMLDTADVYAEGANEELVGRAVADRRDGVVLATKFGFTGPPDWVRGDADHVQRSCEASLKRLGVDHIDLYYQHRVDPKVPIEDTVAAMAELVEQGKVRYLGLSEPAAATIRRAHAIHPITAVQSEWSLWTRDVEAEVAPTCAELGIGLVPFSPLGNGFLTGSVTSLAELGPDDARHGLPRFTPENFDHNQAIATALRTLAADRGVTPAQLALAWLRHQAGTVVPIPGTKRREYLDENVGSLAITLTAADLATIDAAMPPPAGDRYTAEFLRLSYT